MSVLHLVNRSPGESLALLQCLERVRTGDSVLLLEGGVYAVLAGSRFSSPLAEAAPRVHIYALAPDLEVRGIAIEDTLPDVGLVDYEGFVELTLSHSPIQSWF